MGNAISANRTRGSDIEFGDFIGGEEDRPSRGLAMVYAINQLLFAPKLVITSSKAPCVCDAMECNISDSLEQALDVGSELRF